MFSPILNDESLEITRINGRTEDAAFVNYPEIGITHTGDPAIHDFLGPCTTWNQASGEIGPDPSLASGASPLP
jgi:hypothetical protein